MKFILPGILILHAVLMIGDEFWFHKKRNLPLWERWGHPIDTFSVIACYSFALFFPSTLMTICIYIALALLSIILITKDEWVHARLCSGGELWIHALLFILHPVLLLLAGLFLARDRLPFHIEHFRFWLQFQYLASILFLAYQIIYWNGPWKPNLPKPVQK